MSPATRADAGCVEVMALQPIAVVDHLGRPVSKDFLNRNVAIGGHELGGSERVDPSELASLLSKLEADGTDTRIVTKAGGSAANTARGLSRGFGVRAGLLGAVGDDQWGNLFKQAMRDARVDVSNLSEKPGATGRCACFVEEGSGQRTMRTCMQDAVRLEAREILGRLGDRDNEVVGSNPLRGASWVLVPGYAFYGAGLVDALLLGGGGGELRGGVGVVVLRDRAFVRDRNRATVTIGTNQPRCSPTRTRRAS
jgi:hypothetical protein